MNREPVLTAGAISGVIMAGLAMAVSLGWLHLTETQIGTVETFAGALLALLLPILISLWPRSKVTPVICPRTEDGEPAILIPAAQAEMLGIEEVRP